MGYALNLCKFHIFKVPYYHNDVEVKRYFDPYDTQNDERNLSPNRYPNLSDKQVEQDKESRRPL